MVASENCPVPHTRFSPDLGQLWSLGRPQLSKIAGAALVAAMLLTGCGGSTPVTAPSDASPKVAPKSPQGQLLARVAAAQDKRYGATYTLRKKGKKDRTITVELANDGSWLIEVPGGARGGTRDVAIAGNSDGVYQCVLGGRASCVQVAKPGGKVPGAYDPRVQHPFTDWLDVLIDTRAALSVAADSSLPVPRGDCFSVESNSVAMAPPMEAGVYCFDEEGVLTGARFSVGALVLSGGVEKPRTSIKLPGPVTAGRPMPTSPPPPKPSKSASPSPSKS
jgi:hypothetical protein